jgi:hypothetical protein
MYSIKNIKFQNNITKYYFATLLQKNITKYHKILFVFMI